MDVTKAFHSSSSSWVPVNGKFHDGIRRPISGHLSGPNALSWTVSTFNSFQQSSAQVYTASF